MTTEETRAAVSKLAADIGLEMSAAFIPFSQSRNTMEKHKSFNWRVTLTRKGYAAVSTDYMQGLAHVPDGAWKSGYDRRTVNVVEAEARMAEQGVFFLPRHVTSGGFGFGKKLPAPHLADVLYCLLLDASAIEHGCFESWCEEFGYDSDSRKAEAMYRECLSIALRLRALIGGTMAQFSALLQDY